MFNLGDYVMNQKTGHIGKVIGYGHQILPTGYETTLKVLVAESETSKTRGFVEEEIHSACIKWPREPKSTYLNNNELSSLNQMSSASAVD